MLNDQQQKLLRHCRPSTFQHQVVNAGFTILKHKVEYYGGIKILGLPANTSNDCILSVPRLSDQLIVTWC